MFGWLAWIPWHVWLWLGVPLALLAAAWWFFTAQVKAALDKVPLHVWFWMVGSALAIGYHVYAVAQARRIATAVATAEWTAKIATATLAAKADHDKLQGEIDAAAKPSNAALHDQFAKLQATMDAMRVHPGNYAAPKPAKPLPADCKLDPAVVAATNEILRQ